MSVRVAKSAGFCFGVSRAVELVEQAAQAGKKVATLGPIIHNRHVVEKFEKMGVRFEFVNKIRFIPRRVFVRHTPTKTPYLVIRVKYYTLYLENLSSLRKQTRYKKYL